jgi:hypothetical protein
MKKSIYCVGQKIIFNSEWKGRISGVVKSFDTDGSLYLTLSDNTGQFIKPNDPRLEQVESYLDPTSFDYHHSRFAEFQDRAITAFNGYMFAYHGFIVGMPDDVSDKIRDFLENDAAQEAEAYALAVELRDLASMNMAQWGRNTLDHHFPFINPNGVEGYHKF